MPSHLHPRVRRSRRRDGWGLPHPYSPSSPEYGERTGVSEVEVVGFPGMKRVDVGEPIRRLPGEPQPVARRSPAARPASAPAVPSVGPAAPKREPKEPDLKPGIGKHRPR
jgi:hypothetical protein